MNKDFFNVGYPTTEILKHKAEKRIPKFVFDYIIEGCGNDIGLKENRRAFSNVRLNSSYLTKRPEAFTANLATTILGKTYAKPFGISPLGLQGLMWPKAPETLSKTASVMNIPYILSTVSSASLETIAETSNGAAWYQLYNPLDAQVRADLLQRIETAGYEVLVVTVDVPTFGYRWRDIQNGLSMPPKMTLRNLLQMVARPRWCLESLLAGVPELATLKPYMPKVIGENQFFGFMNKTVMGPVHGEALKVLRDSWKGKLVIKGITSCEDAGIALAIGADGIIVSNHGGRQLDIGISSLEALKLIGQQYKGQFTIMMDSGVRSGVDIASAMAYGAEFVFMGRPFVYSLGALGNQGGYHLINMLTQQLTQVMQQVGCASPAELTSRLADSQLNFGA